MCEAPLDPTRLPTHLVLLLCHLSGQRLAAVGAKTRWERDESHLFRYQLYLVYAALSAGKNRRGVMEPKKDY